MDDFEAPRNSTRSNAQQNSNKSRKGKSLGNAVSRKKQQKNNKTRAKLQRLLTKINSLEKQIQSAIANIDSTSKNTDSDEENINDMINEVKAAAEAPVESVDDIEETPIHLVAPVVEPAAPSTPAVVPEDPDAIVEELIDSAAKESTDIDLLENKDTGVDVDLLED
jgi:seryl-tRNA synthetase